MPRYIVKIQDKYLEWSTIVDAPVTYGMNLPEFYEYYKSQYGLDGIQGLSERLERVSQKGTSCVFAKTLENTIGYNRAGKDERRLSEEEIYQKYCVDCDG